VQEEQEKKKRRKRKRERTSEAFPDVCSSVFKRVLISSRGNKDLYGAITKKLSHKCLSHAAPNAAQSGFLAIFHARLAN